MENASKRPSVAVVIPTLYRSQYLDRVLHLLSSQTVLPDEVLVIDQAAPEEIDRAMYNRFKEKLPLRVYHLDVRSQSAARNWGVRLSTAEIYISVDDDTEFDTDFIEQHVKALEQHRCDCICGGVRYKNSELKSEFRVPSAWESVEFTFTHTPLVNYPCHTVGIAGCNFSVKREAILKIDGWDETIPIYGEDRDFPLRLIKAGGSIFFNPEPLVVHLKAPMGGGRYVKDRAGFLLRNLGPIPWPSYLYYYKKHFSGYALITFLISIVLRGWPIYAKYKLKTFLATPFRFIGVLRSYKSANKLYATGPVLLNTHGATSKCKMIDL
jgi:GT2 family glycosyltransferase